MATLSAPTFCFAPAKTWFMPVTYLQRNADGNAGAPVNLTGGIVSGVLFTRGNLTGIPLTVTNGGVTVDPANGAMNFLVDEAATAGFVADNIPSSADSYNYPTRLEVDFRDSLGHLTVAAVFPIHVFDPRFVDPSTFPTQQAGTIVDAGSQPIPAVLTPEVLAAIAAAIAPLQEQIAALQRQIDQTAEEVSAVAAAVAVKGQAATGGKTSIEQASPGHLGVTGQQAIEGKTSAGQGAPASVGVIGGQASSTKSSGTGAQASPAHLTLAGGTGNEAKTSTEQGSPASIKVSGSTATTSKTTVTSSPGGGASNTADHADPNNAYLAAMAA